jgi:Rod binding domain-containing protein
MSVNPMTQAHAAIQGQAANGAKDKNAKLVSAAHQFESVLLGQLLQVLWKSTPELSKGQGSMYQSMFQGEFADHLSAGRGIGLADMIAKGLGADTQTLGASISKELNAVTGARSFKLDPSAAQSNATAVAQSNAPAVGVMASVSAAASGMVGASAGHWAKDGTLTTQDLAPVDATEKAGASARATIQNAHGYQGYYKCNLFAFELARRAGLEVPLTQNGTQIDFPSSNRLTQDASDGSLNTGWAHVATGASPAAMQDALVAGEAAFMLVGQGHAQAHGHMAMIERPRAIDYNSDGSVRSITFDGWEAQPNGAKHLTSRTWNRSGTAGGPGDRNGLDRIEIIRLNRKAAESATDPRAAAPEGVGPHVQPDLGLSKGSQHPTQRSEDRS